MPWALRSLIFSTAFLLDRHIGCMSRVNCSVTFFHPFLPVNTESEKRIQDDLNYSELLRKPEIRYRCLQAGYKIK